MDALGAGGVPEIVLDAFSVTPQRIVIGDTITLGCEFSCVTGVKSLTGSYGSFG